MSWALEAFETPVVALEKSNVAGWKLFFIAQNSVSLGFMVKNQVMRLEDRIGALDVSTMDLQYQEISVLVP